jgi:hypothetical protein
MATFVKKTGAMTSALLAGVLATSLQARAVWAQEGAPPPPPAAEAAPPPPPPAPVVETPAPAPVVTATPAPAPTISTDVNKVQHKKMDPPAIWFRLDNRFQDPSNKKKLNGFVMGSEVDILFSGEVHEYVAWQADFVATFGNQSGTGKDITGRADILDLIGKFNLHDSFNIWVGRMLVPSDRSNFSGAWFMSAWNYPGFYIPGAAPVGPHQGPFGRNDGATVWGQFLGGFIKYYASAFDLHDVNEKALFSGRLNLTLLNPEPGYYHSSTYYGAKDIVALGISGQYKKNGSVAPTPDPLPIGYMAPAAQNYSMVSADLLAEKKFGGAGVGTLEGGFYAFKGDFEPVKNHFYVLGSYLLPYEVWIGRFQPLVRLQQAKSQTKQTWRLIDTAVSYVVDEYAMRIALNYQNSDIGGSKANAVTIGIQIQK